ncbi:hypothetical protein GOP47_0022031 [Adiantum capillus-veneris]|uniref:AIG1-type G domain-containing protein n=1 Tax=Adiantum capillus-veneris TaxID=13818 RepID=A0A9D4U8J8_ADICA|nr:hypothetical protein GOP47_0022031 [Adiantum capillus-veneris]
MAMETSAAFPNDVTKEASSISEEDLTSLDAAKGESLDSSKGQQGGDDAAQDRKEEETLPGEKPKNAADPEGVYVDAEIRKASEDDDGIDDENGSVESYDSALERIAVVSSGDPASPEAPSSPVFQPAETPQQTALRQLNLWNSGVSSLDSTILENASPVEFRTLVTQIAQSQGLLADSEDVEHVFLALLPLVEAKESTDVQGEAEGESKGANDVTAGDGNKDSGVDADESRQEVSNVDHAGEYVEESTRGIPSSHAESNGDVAVDGTGELDKQPKEVLQSKSVADIDMKKENFTSLQESARHQEDFSKETTEKLDKEGVKDSPGDDTSGTGTQVTNYEPEPEVIEWDNSDADDLGNLNGGDPPSQGKEPKETLDLGTVGAAGLQQESESHNDPQGQVEGASNATANSVDEPKEESPRGDEALQVGGQEEGPIVLESGAQPDSVSGVKSAGPEEVSGDASMESIGAVDKEASGDDAGADSKGNEQLLTNVVAEREGDEATPEEFNVDDGKAETLEHGSVESGKADSLKGSEGEILEGTAIGATEVSGVLQAGEEPSAAESPNLANNETLERELGQEQSDLLKEEESPSFENTSVEGGDSATASAVVAHTGSTADESPKDMSKGEDSDKEVPVDTKVATASANDSASSLGGAGPSLPARPAGLGRSVPSLEHAPRAVQRSGGAPASTRQASVSNEENQSSTDVSEGNEDAREKLQMIRVKFLRLAHRLGQSAHNVVVAQVLYRLGLAEQLRGGRGSGRSGAFSFERASVLAEEQEAAGVDDLEFGCTIMVLGKSGVGKSATINSLFDEIKSGTNAYSPATNKVQEIVGTVHGIKLRVIDTPGLLTSFADQRRNERIMSSVKRFIKKSPPDIVLYFDRLDMQSRDYGDLPLLRTITDTFGSAVWFNAIVVLTHASSAPPDGANGVPVSYEMFVAQRSHVVQQTIRQAAGDMRLMNPVSLVENHAACRRNRAGERVLPNGQVWKPQLLLLCFASKILAEANSLLKLQDNSPTKPFGVRSRVPPLPFLLSSLLQSRAQLKLPDEQLLDKEQRRTYAEELEYREKLFMKKQLKDERARKKELKRRLAALPKEVAQYAEESLEDENAAASVPVPMPDMALPPSFDSDNPTYRYRYLDAANQWLVRPVLETHGWDHDSGYDGLNVEKMFVVSQKIPVSVSGQVTKDKKEANLQMECAASFKNGEGKVTQAGLDVQTIGKDLAYTLRSEIRFDNFKRNKTTCGLAVTLLGDTVAAGMKIEDRLLIGKRVKLVFNGGALTGRGDTAFGGSLEATIRDKDYPIGTFLSTFGLSVMDWHGDLAIGGNMQVQCKVGKTMAIVRGNLNNRRAGQVSIRVSSSEQLQMALIGLIPLLRTLINNRILSSN